jgi:beta-glucosidase
MVATTRRFTGPFFAGLVLTLVLLIGPSAGAAARPARAPRYAGLGLASGPPTQPALLPTPRCPVPPSTNSAPWQDPSFGAECQAQYVIEDLENPASALYAHGSSGAPTQSTLQRLEAALAAGDGVDAANGTTTNLLALYGLTVAGGTDDGADGERSSGLSFPSELTVGASWDTQAAAAYGTMLGSEFHRTGLSGVLGPVIDIDRTWHTGREQENFGEDPFLTGSLVAPEVRAIQAQGVMTTVKHCCAYTQEQGRSGQGLSLTNPNDTGENELISERALEEIYGPPWQAAVAPQQGNAMSVMCGYAIVNAATAPPYTGADSCGNEFILNGLIKGEYGFEGTFTPDAATAMRDSSQLNLANGGDGGDVSLTLAQLEAIVGDGSGDGLTNADGSQNIISQARLVDEVRRLVLQSVKDERFLHPPNNDGIDDGIAQDEASSTKIAEEGAVLLANRGVLPISRAVHSIAVIGTQAGPNANTSLGPVSSQNPQAANDGSAFVDPTNVFTDSATGQTFGYSSALSGIVARAGSGRMVSYEPGSVGLIEQPLLTGDGATSGSGSLVTPGANPQPGFLATYYGGNDPTHPAATLGTQVVPSVDYDGSGGAEGQSSFPAVPVSGSPAVAIPRQYQWDNWSSSYQAVYTPAATGDYNFSVVESGTTKLYVAGQLVSGRLRDDFGYIDHATVHLTAGQSVPIALYYSSEEGVAGLPSTLNIFNFNTFLGNEVHLGLAVPLSSGPSLVQQAAAAAGKANVAVVFAGREIGEGHDIESLSLPGDQNQMIEAVAAANPRTIVVLTGGPVTMPWLHQVAGVLEMWEPGATFGTAVASLLFGDSDPSGRLPITFPASDSQGPGATAAEYPGITNLQTGASDDYDQLEQEDYNEGIDVGYRWYETHGQQPLFPFGFGLSYTTFTKRIVNWWPDRDGDVVVRVADTNRGRVAGADVVEGYVHDPASTGEPPEQLRAFQRVWLAPGETKLVTLEFRPSSFAYWASGPATGTTPGTTSPTTPTATPSSQPPGHWTIAAGPYRIDVGGSSAQFDGSVTLRLGQRRDARSLTGLFGWRLGGAGSRSG